MRIRILNAFFILVFISKANCCKGTQTPELEDGNRERDEVPIIQWETVSDLLYYLCVHKYMGLDRIQVRVLK